MSRGGGGGEGGGGGDRAKTKRRTGRTDRPSVFCFHRVVLNFSALLLAVY